MNIFTKIYLVISSVAIINSSCFCAVIDVVAYREDGTTDLIVKRIDLDLKAVIKSVEIPFQGELLTKMPIKFQKGGTQYSLILTVDGVSCKNCAVGERLTRYAVINDSLEVIRIDSLIGTATFSVISTSNDSMAFKVLEAPGNTNEINHKARYLITNNFSVQKYSDLPNDYNTNRFPNMNNYNNLHMISSSRTNIFWDTDTSFNVHLLDIDPRRTNINHDIDVGNFINRAQLIGFAAELNIFYVFSISDYSPLMEDSAQNINLRPSFLKRYSTDSFSLIDSIDIPNCSIDSGYVRNELAQCEKAGRYFVYYFFGSDGMRYYSPAMLFIFDTRTNQATWLRVGWR
jgi:hypothetical protein